MPRPTLPKTPQSDSWFWTAAKGVTWLNVALFRATKGRVGGGVGRARILVLHHVGRKSGAARETPLLYLADGPDRLVIVASKGGVDQHPAWFHNLMAMETTEVELPGGERRRVAPRLASAEERDAYWPRLVHAYPPFESYRRATTRTIPLVVLEGRQT